MSKKYKSLEDMTKEELDALIVPSLDTLAEQIAKLEKIPLSMGCQCTEQECSICKEKGEKKMAFKKTGVAPIEDIYCSCGGKVNKETKKCDKCGKEFVAKD